jgi:hypothetical protein
MTDNINSCTCPAATSTATNRSKLSAIWSSDEWKEFVRVNTAGKECEQCHKKEGDIAVNSDGEDYTVHLTVDHPFRWAYKSKELYLDFNKAMCRVVCRTCNSCFERGLDICPECLKNYKQMREPICRECLFKKHPEAKIAFEQGQQDQKERQAARSKKKRAQSNPFPCAHKLLSGRCTKSQQQCTFSRQKCLRDPKKGGCPKARPRKLKEDVKK